MKIDRSHTDARPSAYHRGGDYYLFSSYAPGHEGRMAALTERAAKGLPLFGERPARFPGWRTPPLAVPLEANPRKTWLSRKETARMIGVNVGARSASG